MKLQQRMTAASLFFLTTQNRCMAIVETAFASLLKQATDALPCAVLPCLALPCLALNPAVSVQCVSKLLPQMLVSAV